MIITGKAKHEAMMKREPARDAIVHALRPIIRNHKQFNLAVEAVMRELTVAGVIPDLPENE